MVGSLAVLLEDQLYYWKINYIIGRSIVLLEKINYIEDNFPELW